MPAWYTELMIKSLVQDVIPPPTSEQLESLASWLENDGVVYADAGEGYVSIQGNCDRCRKCRKIYHVNYSVAGEGAYSYLCVDCCRKVETDLVEAAAQREIAQMPAPTRPSPPEPEMTGLKIGDYEKGIWHALGWIGAVIVLLCAGFMPGHYAGKKQVQDQAVRMGHAYRAEGSFYWGAKPEFTSESAKLTIIRAILGE